MAQSSRPVNTIKRVWPINIDTCEVKRIIKALDKLPCQRPADLLKLLSTVSVVSLHVVSLFYRKKVKYGSSWYIILNVKVKVFVSLLKG